MTSRATSHEPSAPRLPSRSPEEVQAAFVAANATPVSNYDMGEGTAPPAYENPVVFEVPELLPLRAVSIGWIAARVAIVLWTMAIAVVAIRTTNRIDGVAPGDSIAAAGDDMSRAVLVGVVLVAALVATSVLWSRTIAENTRRLRGRWPSVNRATRVWFYPTVWVAFSALTFLRVEVEEFDPFPALAAIVFALALYCPYSMIHRVFKTLTRLRPDAAIRAAYVLDLAGFGMIWWRLTDWPDPITAADSGTVDTMAWAAIASSGLLLISAGIMASLAHQAGSAQHYRIRMLATRHVQGLPLPVVPRRAWGRVRTSIDDAVARGAGPVGDVVRASDLVVGPGGAPSPVVVAARRTVVAGPGAAAARTGDVPPAAPGTVPATPRTPTGRPLEVGGADVAARRAAGRGGEPPVARRPPGAAGRVAARRPRRPAEGGDVPGRRYPGSVPARSGAGARRAPGRAPARGQPPAPRRRSAPPRRAVAAGAAGQAVARRRAAAQAAAAASVGDATGQAAAPAAGDMAARRAASADAARRRVRDDRAWVEHRVLERREAAAGEPAAAGAPAPGGPPRTGADQPGRRQLDDRRQRPAAPGPAPAGMLDVDEPPEATTLVGVARVAALAAHLALAGTFVWFVVEARRASASSRGGDLDPDVVDRLDLVRTLNVVMLAVTVLLIGAWAGAAALLVRRGERARPGAWAVAAPAVPAALLVIGALLVDGRVGGGVLFPFAVLVAGLGGACCLVLLSMAVGDSEPGAHGLYLWAAAIGVVGLGLAIGGYLQEIDPTDSLTTVTLVAILSGILVGLGVLLGAPATGEVDELVSDASTTGSGTL